MPAPKLTAHDFHPDVLKLFDQYVHGGIDRRGFLDRAARYAVGGTTAAGLLAALSPDFANAQQVAPTDPRLKGEKVEFESTSGYAKVRGYLVRPVHQSAEQLPAILVVHENRGLNPHIEDIARRLALAQFVVFAPDALAPLGGYPGDEDKARELFGRLDQQKTTEDFVASAAWLRGVPGTSGKLGVVGFCWGGGMANTLAEQVPEVAAAVPFYGIAPPLDKVGAIKGELLLNFADTDERINASWPPYEAALKQAKVKYQAYRYAGTQHGFNNDTTPRYDAKAAGLAWERTVAFFDRTLRAKPANAKA